ncbi:hypothetical protein KEM48_007406 [Puccinia striiformis f. sp. tritici PST-130]|nr:hypothetical protein KEM48_007406 [Puccinia striiformis f. sp. tritici PST-130]
MPYSAPQPLDTQTDVYHNRLVSKLENSPEEDKVSWPNGTNVSAAPPGIKGRDQAVRCMLDKNQPRTEREPERQHSSDSLDEDRWTKIDPASATLTVSIGVALEMLL